MTTLTRWNPYTEMQRMQRDIDQVFDSFFSDWPSLHNGTAWQSFNLDLSEKDGEYVIQATLPGLKSDEIDVAIEDNVLRITGETKSDNRFEDNQYLVRERRYGSFVRNIMLPGAVDDGKAKASLEDGVLTIHLPKSSKQNGRVRHLKLEKQGKHGKLNIINRLKKVLPLPKRNKKEEK